MDFTILVNNWRNLVFFDDVFLNMQGINIGCSDEIITEMEESLQKYFIEHDKAHPKLFFRVAALSQMWIFATYELLRLWRERLYEFKKWHNNGGIETKLGQWRGDDSNIQKQHLISQLEEYRDSQEYREQCDLNFTKLEPAIDFVGLFRINLAKHSAPGRSSVVLSAPGYGRVNGAIGAIDYEIEHKDGSVEIANRREVADLLRSILTD